MIMFSVVRPHYISAPEAAPQQVECLPLSSSGLHLKWRAPSHDLINGQIKGYRVLFVPFPGRQPAVQTNLNSARLSAVIGTSTALTGLKANTNYSVQVLAYTSAGDGLLSSPLSCSTESDGELLAVSSGCWLESNLI